MKMKSLILFVFCCLYLGTQAQYTPLVPQLALENKSKVFFASGSFELDKKAVASLDELLLEYDETRQAEFRLQAFTDDVGSAKQNEALAEQRAASVQNYLAEQGVALHAIKIIATQQLSLDPDKNAAEQRRENRRVGIEYWALPISEKALSANENNGFSTSPNSLLNNFFVNEQTKANQIFRFEGAKGQIIEGRKGTILQIPPNCFVDEAGNIVSGEITFTLREAYSFGDLMLQNLSTTAGDELLETGGTIFLGAKDEAGNELSIRNGAAITAAMASKEASLPGMQTFEGQVDDGGNVDWAATEQPVQAVNRRRSLVNNFDYSKTKYYQVSEVEDDIKQLENSIVWNQKLPKAMTKPRFRLRAPKAPRLRAITAPDRTDLATKYPQRSNESNVEYKNRVYSKYRDLLSTYRKHRSYNRSKLAQFRRDSLGFERSLAKHEAATAKYQAYNEQMRAVMNELQDNIADFNIDNYANAHDALSDFFGEASQSNAVMNSVLENIERNAASYAKDGYAMDDILEMIQTSSVKKLSKGECQQLKKAQMKQNTDYFASKFYNTKFSSTRQVSSRMRSYKYSIGNLYYRIPTDEINPYKLSQIRKWRERIEDRFNFKWLKKTNDKTVEAYSKRKALVDRFIAMEKHVQKVQKAFMTRKNELGLLNPYEIAAAYNNAMTITKMGWINCDRFYRDPSPRTNIQIVTESVENTTIYIAFEGINAIMRANPGNDGKFYASNLPANRKVKIFGLRVIGQNAEFFVEQGAVGKLSKFKPDFQERTVEEVAALVAAL